MRTVIIASAAVGLCVLAGCDSLEADAKEAVASRLKDPSSAEFRNLRIVEQVAGADAVCGEVNGKNSFGAYSGYQQFVYKGGSVYIGSDDVASIQARTRFCIKGGRSDEEWQDYLDGVNAHAATVAAEAAQP